MTLLRIQVTSLSGESGTVAGIEVPRLRVGAEATSTSAGLTVALEHGAIRGPRLCAAARPAERGTVVRVDASRVR